MEFDLRSDTFTKPSADMLLAMVTSNVGDDVYGEDPTVFELECRVAQLCGKPAALFCCSSTMSNQLALRVHLSQPPSSLICHQNAHVFQYEAGGAAFHSQAHTIPIAPQESYNLTRKDIEPRLVLNHYRGHCPVTQLICLENTLAGAVMPLEDIRDIYALSQQHQIKVHMDGSRLWNASVATGISLQEYSKSVDSLNLCLSKSMGCPVGAMLVGSQAFIDRARIFRKLFGGGWRQAGVLAAAGLYAIDHIWPTMLESHRLAKKLAEGLQDTLQWELVCPVDTNMVVIRDSPRASYQMLIDGCKARGIVLDPPSYNRLRIVLHHQINDHCVDQILQLAHSFIN